MKNLIIIMVFCTQLITSHVTSLAHGSCLDAYQKEIQKKSLGIKKVNKAGIITTGTTLGVVGGFYGVMAINLLGPWWTFFAVGGPFGIVAAAPVGATFFVISKIKSSNLKNTKRMFDLISLNEETIEDFYQYALSVGHTYSRDTFKQLVKDLDIQNRFCDGSMRRSSRILARPKDFRKYLRGQFNLL